MQLRNIVNGTSYKICYNSTTFSCGGDCTQRDGTISGSSVDIEMIAPAEGVTQNNVIRVYSGSGCTNFKDFAYSVYSLECSKTRTGVIVVDMRFTSGGSGGDSNNNCRTNIARDIETYITLNTPGVSENGQKAMTRASAEKNVPNGNSVPNTMLVASPGISCNTNTAFYRHQINLPYLKAKYPDINTFTFEVWSRVSLGTSNISYTPVINLLSNVRTKAKPVGTECNGTTSAPSDNTDAGRDPCRSDTSPGTVYNSSTINGTSFTKSATLTYNFTTNVFTTTWIKT